MSVSEEKDIIKAWLKKCNDTRKKPWLWDFKEELLEGESKQCDNPIKRIFEWYINADSKYLKGETEETKLAKSIYSYLWNIDIEALDKKTLDMDVMNSFWTTYKQGLKLKYEKICTKWKDDKINTDTFDELIKEKEYEKYHCLNEDFLKFAELTHTIGNFTIEPKGYNRGRGGNDYWDYALTSPKLFEPLGLSFEQYVNTYFMQPYVSKDYSVVKLWYSNKVSGSLPEKYEDILSFLSSVTSAIEERGKYMVGKLCKKIAEEDSDFKKNMDEFFFNDSNRSPRICRKKLPTSPTTYTATTSNRNKD